MSHTNLPELANSFRINLLKAANAAEAGHVGGSLSELDLLTVLYFNVMQIRPEEPRWPQRDRFVLSKGHASLGLYTVLAGRGYFYPAELLTFDGTDTRLQAHPDMHKCPGIDYSTGSLGQGLSVGIGMAQGAAMRGESFRTFVLLGDGESQEGQVWEALMYAGSRKVANLVAIFDYNKVQLSAPIKNVVDIAPLDDKLRAFGWHVLEVDGHDIAALQKTLSAARNISEAGPVAVVANTVKGKGVSFMENNFQWHGKAPNDTELAAAIKELEGCIQ